MNKAILVWLALMLASALNVNAAQPTEIDQIKALLEQPEAEIDFARTKLALDQLIDPEIDVEANLKRIDQIVLAVRGMLGFNSKASSAEKVITLNKYLYKKGPWNNYQIYQYDFDDPLGIKIENKLLPNYLKTRKGNCVSMPALFIAVGQRLGLDVSLSTAPHHIFVKFRDDATGKIHNFETTSGGGKTDEKYKREKQITNRAVSTGIYLEKLTKRHSVAVLAQVVAENYQRKNEARVIQTSKLILNYYPKSVNSMLRLASAYYNYARKNILPYYSNTNDMPEKTRDIYKKILQRNTYWFEQAKSLGWKRPTQQQEKNYKTRINSLAKQI